MVFDWFVNLCWRTCLQSHLQTSPPEVISKVSEPQDNVLKYPPFQLIVRGEGGSPNFFLSWNPLIFVIQAPMQNFGTIQQFLKIPPLYPQICHSASPYPNLFGRLESFYFCQLGANAKFPNPTLILKNTPLVHPNMSQLLVRSTCKISEPYDNPFWDFE